MYIILVPLKPRFCGETKSDSRILMFLATVPQSDNNSFAKPCCCLLITMKRGKLHKFTIAKCLKYSRGPITV